MNALTPPDRIWAKVRGAMQSFPILGRYVIGSFEARPDDAATEYVRADLTVEPKFCLRAHLARQRAFSEKTFGPGARAKGVVDHIRKELAEIEANPGDLSEWIDVVILALDGAWRAGHDPDSIIAALVAKQGRNEARIWPDWRTADPDKAIEHDRSGEGREATNA